jgi:hypothetical protein
VADKPRNPVPSGAADAPASPTLQPAQPNLRWMGKSRQWGTRVKSGKHGLRLGDLNVGIYGEVPPVWTDQTRAPRGAMSRRGVPPLGYAVRDKVDLWADSAADMYEEAIQRRWAPAVDVPWETLVPLPYDVERAICQVCTELSQYANADVESVTYWQSQMAYGYHEIKQFLATVSFDAARHMEVFRKRALCNGGGLGLEGPGEVNRMILESRGGWTEAVLYLLVLRGLFTQTMYRYLERYAHSDAERVIFGRCLQDKARHLTYGIDHLRYAVNHQDDQNLILTQLCIIGERVLVRELRDTVLRSALAIVFGDGIAGIDAGSRVVDRMMFDYVSRYLDTMKWLGVERTTLFPDELAAYLKTPGARSAS